MRDAVAVDVELLEVVGVVGNEAAADAVGRTDHHALEVDALKWLDKVIPPVNFSFSL